MARLIIEKCCYILSAKQQQIKKKIEEQQELAPVFGEKTFRLVHNLPDDGSGRI